MPKKKRGRRDGAPGRLRYDWTLDRVNMVLREWFGQRALGISRKAFCRAKSTVAIKVDPNQLRKWERKASRIRHVVADARRRSGHVKTLHQGRAPAWPDEEKAADAELVQLRSDGDRVHITDIQDSLTRHLPSDAKVMMDTHYFGSNFAWVQLSKTYLSNFKRRWNWSNQCPTHIGQKDPEDAPEKIALMLATTLATQSIVYLTWGSFLPPKNTGVLTLWANDVLSFYG